jgi:hypothetical protein
MPTRTTHHYIFFNGTLTRLRIYLSTHDRLCKRAVTPVVRLFNTIRETAGGQFMHIAMVPDALTAHSFARAWFVAAITIF